MGNKSAPSNLIGSQHAEDLRDIFFRPALTALGSGQHATEVERERVDTDALIARHDAEQHAPPAAQFGQVVSGLDDFRVSGAVDGDVGQSTENFLHPLGGILARGVDLMRQAVFGSLRQFVVMQVDADDRLCPSEFGAKDCSKPDAPYPEDDDGFIGFDLGIVVDDTEAGCERVGEQAAQFEICFGRNFGQTVFGNDRVFLESGDGSRVHITSVPLIDRTAGINPRPRTPMTDHTIPGRDVCHVRANFKHDSSRFMPKQMRKELVRAFDPIDLPDLRSANARGVNIDKDLSAFERRNFDLVDDQRCALFDQNGGGCLQSLKPLDPFTLTETRGHKGVIGLEKAGIRTC